MDVYLVSCDFPITVSETQLMSKNQRLVEADLDQETQLRARTKTWTFCRKPPESAELQLWLKCCCR